MRVTSDSQLAIAASQTAKKPDAGAGEIKQREQQRVHREKARHLLPPVCDKACMHHDLAPGTPLEQRQALLDESLAGEIADRLACVAVFRDRKRRRRREIGIFRLLGEFVMRQVIGAVA